MDTIINLIDSILQIIDRVFIRSDRYLLWLTGLQNTLLITFFALLLGIAIGFFVAVIRVTHDSVRQPHILIRIPNRIVTIYVTAIRGIPMMVQLMIMNFIVFAASRNLIMIGMLAFGINSGAYVSEVFLGGIQSVDKGQTEAGRSLGLNFPQTMLKIIMPQAIKNSLPALGNEFIALLKETSIAGVIGIMDITRAGAVIRGLTYDPTPLIFVASFYLILVMFLEFLVGKMEKRLKKSDRPVVAKVERQRRTVPGK